MPSFSSILDYGARDDRGELDDAIFVGGVDGPADAVFVNGIGAGGADGLPTRIRRVWIFFDVFGSDDGRARAT